VIFVRALTVTAESGPAGNLLRIEGVVEGVAVQIEELPLVDEAAGLDQAAGTDPAFGVFDLGFLLGERAGPWMIPRISCPLPAG